MSSMIVSIKGLVKHSVMLDPGVWIFDERKVNLNTYFTEGAQDHEEASIEKLSRAWDSQRTKGALPRTNSNKVEVDKKDLTENSLGVPLAPFLSNASPLTGAKTVTFSLGNGNGEFSCPLEEAKKGILAFSIEGQPLKETGPVHFYFGDGSNEHDPVTHIQAITVS